MRVFITGGAGFIGSHLADLYLNAGHQVTLLDNFSTGSTANIAHLEGIITTVDGDIRNIELIQQLTKDSDDPVISALYPYTSISEKNENNYRYNLLPARKQRRSPC